MQEGDRSKRSKGEKRRHAFPEKKPLGPFISSLSTVQSDKQIKLEISQSHPKKYKIVPFLQGSYCFNNYKMTLLHTSNLLLSNFKKILAKYAIKSSQAQSSCFDLPTLPATSPKERICSLLL